MLHVSAVYSVKDADVFWLWASVAWLRTRMKCRENLSNKVKVIIM
jgi:hypothetical protein